MNVYIGITILTLLVVAGFAWFKGTNHPSKVAEEKIERKSIQNKLSAWYSTRVWTCVEVIDDWPGFMGCPTRAVILEGDKERVRLLYYDDDIVVGTEVKLRLRTDEELKNGVWISTVNEYMMPV